MISTLARVLASSVEVEVFVVVDDPTVDMLRESVETEGSGRSFCLTLFLTNRKDRMAEVGLLLGGTLAWTSSSLENRADDSMISEAKSPDSSTKA